MGLRDCIQYSVPNQDCCEDFGSCAILSRYESSSISCGQGGDRGCPTKLDIIIEIQPSIGLTNGEKITLTEAGHSSESMYKFFYNPHHPENIANNGGQPLFLVGSDSRFTTEGFDSKVINHADVIEWMGETFMVCVLQNWAGETCTSSNTCDIIDHQAGFLGRWMDKNNERLATIDNDSFCHDGDIQQ